MKRKITKSFRLTEETVNKLFQLATKYRKAKSEVLEEAVEYLYSRGTGEIEELRKKVKELKETIEIMKNEREAINEVKKLYQNEIERKNNEIKTLQNEIQKLQNEIKEKEKKKWGIFK